MRRTTTRNVLAAAIVWFGLANAHAGSTLFAHRLTLSN
jgi:hypothetical protein